MSALLKILLVIITILYPIVVYVGLQNFDASYLVVLLVAMAAIRSINLDKSPINHWLWIPLIALLALWTGITNTDVALKLYPVFINGAMLAIFLWSLLNPPSMIERFARLQDADLPDAAIPYTRRVTVIWCVFFVANGLIALITVFFTSDEVWALYNGFISYMAMGLLFAGEYLYRRLFVKIAHE